VQKIQNNIDGVEELRAARKLGYGLIGAVFLFSFFVNALMLTGPLFMMQVYDRVLGSRSEATLIALFLLVAFLYATMGILDYARGRVLARAGQKFQDALQERVWYAVLDRTRNGKTDQLGATALRDLDSISRLYASPLLLALCDIPWTPVFLGAIFLFHPMLGMLALAGGAFIICLTILNQIFSKDLERSATSLGATAGQTADLAQAESDIIRGLGMRGALYQRWKAKSNEAALAKGKSGDRTSIFSTLSKVFRLFLQSAMLAMGAWQVLRGDMTGGAMIASSILMGRALAPIDQSISQWPILQRARLGWENLSTLFAQSPKAQKPTSLPRPKSSLEVAGLTVVPPGSGSPVLRNVSFNVPPGKALGLIGPSGSGKSSLARAIAGIWPAAGGSIRLDGATLDQYEVDALGQMLGYLPQRVTLFSGTIAENIARMSTDIDNEAVIRAAKAAGAHDLILKLPKGYDTHVSPGDTLLSGGQVQRIGLARALFGDPVLVILDEPNSNLDEAGSAAVNAAIVHTKARGASVIIIAHRPSVISSCEALLHIDAGLVKAFGPRDQVLKSQVANHARISEKSVPAQSRPASPSSKSAGQKQ
jgi:ATP-binding cassette subfamily C protein